MPEPDYLAIVKKARDDHFAKASEYERGGNVEGSMYLRYVGNMLHEIVEGRQPTTILQ